MRVAEMVASGLVATALMDLWQQLLRATAGVPVSDWSLVGRWFGHVPRGRLFHAPIGQATPVPNERAIGWIGHYATGIVYGFVYVPLMRAGFGLEPSIVNGLVFGAASVYLERWRCGTRSRAVAQPGSAPALGAGGRRFESGRPDH